MFLWRIENAIFEVHWFLCEIEIICGIAKIDFYGEFLHFYGELKNTNNQNINQKRTKNLRLLWGILAFLWRIEIIL